MIKNSTVLVLGAGASIPYGFPAGFPLLKTVSQRVASATDPLYRILRDTGEQDDVVRTFGEVLWRSGQGSIDAFLENRTDFLRVGKRAIAAALMPIESVGNLFPGESPDDWLRYIAPFVLKTRDAFEASQLTVITFNYDRAFEYFLFTALRNSYNLSEEEAARAISRVNVIHLHGRLGAPHWEGGVAYARGLSPEVSAESVIRCGEQIKIVHEANADSDREFHLARQAFDLADRIVFLGFGYHERNVVRLKIPIHSAKLQLFGSTYGMKGGELDTAMGLLGNRMDRRWIDSSLNSREFLRTLPLATW